MGIGTRWSLAGSGVVAACAIICCSAPLLLVALPGLALIVGWAAEAVEIGLVAALGLAVVVGGALLLRHRRRGACFRGVRCAASCCAGHASSNPLMTGRLITVNDIYSFDPNAEVCLEEFVDMIGRNLKQPEEGLGFDNGPVAHMWRTMIWPTKYL